MLQIIVIAFLMSFIMKSDPDVDEYVKAYGTMKAVDHRVSKPVYVYHGGMRFIVIVIEFCRHCLLLSYFSALCAIHMPLYFVKHAIFKHVVCIFDDYYLIFSSWAN